MTNKKAVHKTPPEAKAAYYQVMDS